MKTNQGFVERVARIAVGTALLAAFFLANALPAALSWMLGVSGAVLVGTGFIAYCPAWHLLGISTAKGTVHR